jgi:hypothetical protein
MRDDIADRWGWDANTVKPYPCASCVHRIMNPPYPVTCAAFPASVPEAIRRGDHLHTSPFPGDGGVQYQPLPNRLPPEQQMPR